MLYIYNYIYRQSVFVFEGDFWNEWTSFSLLNLEGSDSEIAMEKRERERGVDFSFFRYVKKWLAGAFRWSSHGALSWQHLWQGFRCDQWCASRARCGIRPSSFCLKTTRARWQMQVKQKRLWRPGAGGFHLDGCNEARSVTLDLCHGSPLGKSNSTHKYAPIL